MRCTTLPIHDSDSWTDDDRPQNGALVRIGSIIVLVDVRNIAYNGSVPIDYTAPSTTTISNGMVTCH